MRLADFHLTASDFGRYGRDLQRPECVWVDRDGVWTSDLRGGIALVPEHGAARVVGSGIHEPNGFSRRPDGSFVVAGIGDGALWSVAADGTTRRLLDSFEGKPLGTVNYACADGPDRIWLSMMTRAPAWTAALTSAVKDGYILRVDSNGARAEIVADGLDLTNEVKVYGRHLYAAETFGARMIRHPIRPDGSLGAKEIVGPDTLGPGTWPDGFTFDPFGNLWVTIISRNGLLVIDRHGDTHMVWRDDKPEAVAALAAGLASRTGTVEQLVACTSENGPLKMPTSLAFGGPDGRTAYVGSLGADYLPVFRLPESLG